MTSALDRIDHVVVLMLENRSFDHVLGFAKARDPRIDGLTGGESNADADGARVRVSDDAKWVDDLVVDPSHAIADVARQIYGAPVDSFAFDDGDNDGFVTDFAAQLLVDARQARRAMACFSPERMPVIHELAASFAVCDRWHASVPSSTWPNRLFAHAATSYGAVDNVPREYPMRTIYESLEAAGQSWSVYFHDVPLCLLLASLREPARRANVHRIDRFFDDARAGTLPSYSFIEPRYLDFLWWRANDQHPNHDVRFGELLVVDVYEALRASPLWERTLFVVAYDEHGGLYDHVFPPRAPSPDGRAWKGDGLSFDFTRLGVRVPAVLVSPWIAAGTVDHTLYDHTSILATVRDRFGLASLTARDAAAATFADTLSLDRPRTDAPTKLARPSIAATVLDEIARELSPAHILAAIEGGAAAVARVTEHELSFVRFVESLPLDDTPAERAAVRAKRFAKEHDVATHVHERMKKYLGR